MTLVRFVTFSKVSTVKMLALLLLLAGYLLVYQQFKPIDVEFLNANASSHNENKFSAERAFEDLSNLLLSDEKELPHPIDSEANHAVASRLISTMRALGYQEEIQQQEFCIDRKNGSAKCAQVKNILFRVNGTAHLIKNNNKNSNQAILLSAHYDSVNSAPGASDAGTAVATLIEIARLLVKQPRALNDIVFLFNDGEEAGLLGAHAFMQSHPYAKEIKWVLNLDAIGSSGRSLMIETDRNNGELINLISQVTTTLSPTPIASSFIALLWENMPSDTDMTIYRKYGLNGLNFINLEGTAHYHTPLDNLENVDLGSLQEHGDHLWTLLNGLIQKPIIEDNSVDRRVYQDIIGFGIVHWNQATGIITSIATLLIFLGVLILFKKDVYKFWYSLTSTSVVFVSILVVSVITAVILKKGIQLVSFKLNGTSEPWFSEFLPMQLFLITGVFLVASVYYELVKNFICYPLLAILMPLTLSVIAVMSAIFLPKLSGLFIVGSVLSLVIFIPVFITRYRNSFTSERVAYRVSGILLAAISMMIFAPSLYLLEVMMNFYWTPFIGFFIAIVFMSGASLTFSGNKNNSLSAQENKSIGKYVNQLEFRSLDKIALFLLFVSCTVWVLVNPIYTAKMPNSLNLQYLQFNNSDKQKQEAFILAGNKLEKLNPRLLSTFKGESGLKIISAKPWSSTKYLSSEIGTLEIKPIAIKVISDIKRKGFRKIKLKLEGNGAVLKNKAINDQVRKNITINDIKLFFPLSAKLKSIDTGSNLISYEDDDLTGRTHYGFHCIGMSCRGLTLDIEFEKESPFSFSLIETRKGLPTELDSIVFLKGDKLIEKGKGDRVIISQDIIL